MLTLVTTVSADYIGLLTKSLATVSPAVKVIISWQDSEPPRPLIDALVSANPSIRACYSVVCCKRHFSNFRRGYGINVAAQHVDTSFMVISDADFLFPSMAIDTGRLCAEKGVVVRFFIGKLSETFTRDNLAKWSDYHGYAGFNGNKFETIFSGLQPCIYATSDFYNLRGFDERYEGWGREDDDLARRGHLAGLKDVQAHAIVSHIWHPNPPSIPHYRTAANGEQLFQGKDQPAIVNPAGWGDLV